MNSAGDKSEMEVEFDNPLPKWGPKNAPFGTFKFSGVDCESAKFDEHHAKLHGEIMVVKLR